MTLLRLLLLAAILVVAYAFCIGEADASPDPHAENAKEAKRLLRKTHRIKASLKDTLAPIPKAKPRTPAPQRISTWPPPACLPCAASPAALLLATGLLVRGMKVVYGKRAVA